MRNFFLLVASLFRLYFVFIYFCAIATSMRWGAKHLYMLISIHQERITKRIENVIDKSQFPIECKDQYFSSVTHFDSVYTIDAAENAICY